MFGKNTIIGGIVSGVILATISFATPASAGQASFKLEVGLEQLLDELLGEDVVAPKAEVIQYDGVPIRKIRRQLRKRGLYPVSEYRLRGDVVILRAEDDFGTVFRVVADADYGDILRIRQVRAARNYRPAPVDPPVYDNGYDNYRPNYGNTYTERDVGRPDSNAATKAAKSRARAARKSAKSRARAARKSAKSRAFAARKAAKSRAFAAQKAANRANGRGYGSQSRAEAASRKAAKSRAQASRKAAKSRARASRKAAKSRARASRKAAKARADRNRRATAGSRTTALPYVGLSPEEYKIQQYGGGQ